VRQTNDGTTAVEIGNPKTVGFEICRTNLLTGLLKTVQSSGKAIPLPLNLFEVTDVVLLDAEVEVDGTRVGARNQRMAGAVVVNTTDCFEVVHGLIDRLMVVFAIQKKGSKIDTGLNPRGITYEYVATDNPTYFDNRSANIVVDTGKKTIAVGNFGVVHPEVMKNFKIDDKGAASALEINVQDLLDIGGPQA
jgi:phenylalanyl-tRNA synthetase beta chain